MDDWRNQKLQFFRPSLIITIKVARKFGENIKLITNSNGKNVDLTGVNLRVIDKETHIEVHYAAEKEITKPCGDQVIGVDKGYTEALTDSDGEHHGVQFGKVMTAYSDAVAKTGKSRNKLHALEKKHREAGRIAKADRILKNNLGRKKITARKEKARKQLRDIAYRAAHSVVDKAALVVSEDLTAVIASKHQWKKFNRRMSAWAKGVLAQALEEVTHQRGGQHTLVNAAYTSQMDSTNGLLEGKRVGDKFYRANGDVLQADVNAARNVLARLSDTGITRFMPFKEVRSILLSRSPAQLSVMGLELDAANSVCQPSADKSFSKLVSNFG
ncbi:MAG: transposase [Sedimenticola sp.]